MNRKEKIDYYMSLAANHSTRRVVELLLDVVAEERKMTAEARTANREAKP